MLTDEKVLQIRSVTAIYNVVVAECDPESWMASCIAYEPAGLPKQRNAPDRSAELLVFTTLYVHA